MGRMTDEYGTGRANDIRQAIDDAVATLDP
jgi:hypothetical protein